MGTPVAVAAAVAPSLPDDILIDILTRLPAKSVLRCRCLSRAWAATLSSDHFAHRHRRLANHRNSPRVFFLHYSFRDGPLMHTWSQQGCPNEAPWRMDDAISSRGTGHDHKAATIRIAALECRGLVLLEAFRREINYLCNPSTRQVTALPQGHKKLSTNSCVDGHYACLGLGYDVHKKQHRVVRIYYRGSWACDHEGHPRSAGCEVYAVGATGRQRWQPIQEKPPGWARPNHPSAFVQGHVYWLATRNFTNIPMDMVIMSFSLADHTFGTVPPPFGMDSESLSKHQLTKLGDEHLCLFSHIISHGSRYDIWLLAQHGERLWNLHCRIDMSNVSPGITGRYMDCWLNPLAIINNGSRILFERPRVAHTDKYSRLCAYDPVTGDVEDVFSGSNMVYNHMVEMETTVYEETIVFPG